MVLCSPSGAHTCGWLTRGRFLFFASPKKRNQKKGDPDGATTPCASRLCLPVVRQDIPVLTDDARLPDAPLQACGQRLAMLGRAIRGPNIFRGLTPLVLLNSVAFKPRRRASVEDRPKLSPTGCAMDRTRAHPAQGRAVCAPPEADTDARYRRSRRVFRGKMALVTFPERKVTRGRRGRSTPRVAVQDVAEGDTIYSILNGAG